MEDKKLTQLNSFDPMKDGQLLLVSEQKDGVWKSGKVSTNTIAQYVMPEVLGKLKGADNINIAPIAVPKNAPNTGINAVTPTSTEIVNAYGILNIVIPIKQRIPRSIASIN